MSAEPTKPQPPIPPVADWPRGAWSWVDTFGSLESAPAYAALFWPQFTEHDSCVFLESDTRYYADWMTRLGGDRSAVEAMMNHRHILDLFPQTPATEPHRRDLVVSLGRVLKEIWGCKLQRDFPDDRFTVSFPDGPREDPLDYEITFFRDRGTAI